MKKAKISEFDRGVVYAVLDTLENVTVQLDLTDDETGDRFFEKEIEKLDELRSKIAKRSGIDV